VQKKGKKSSARLVIKKDEQSAVAKEVDVHLVYILYYSCIPSCTFRFTTLVGPSQPQHPLTVCHLYCIPWCHFLPMFAIYNSSFRFSYSIETSEEEPESMVLKLWY
jgi:hypothetical protein